MYSITIHNLGTTCLEETIQNRYLSKLIALSLHMTKHLVKFESLQAGNHNMCSIFNLHTIIKYTSGLRELLFTQNLYSGFRPWYGGNHLWQLKSKELTLQQKYLSRDIDINKIGICISNYSNRTVETTFLGQSWICLLFSRKQQQIFIICCWQYHIRNQRTRLPQ